MLPKPLILKASIIAAALAAGKFSLRYMETEYTYWPIQILTSLLSFMHDIEFDWVNNHGSVNKALHIVVDHSCIGSGFFMLILALFGWHFQSDAANRGLGYYVGYWFKALLFSVLATMLVNIFRLSFLIKSITLFPVLAEYKGEIHTYSGIALFAGSLFVCNHLIVTYLNKRNTYETC